MKLTPVLTEKSLSEAKNGAYTFWANPEMTKSEIKRAIEEIFEVHVTSVKTINYRKRIRKNFRGQREMSKAGKKAIVTLAEKEKIELFEEKSK